MRFKEGARVHITRFYNEAVDFYATLQAFDRSVALLTDCSDSRYANRCILRPTDEDFGEEKEDYYVRVTK